MYYLYILKSTMNNRYYVGVSNNPHRRLTLHNAGEVRSTKAYRPYTIVHTERFNNLLSARTQELKIKRAGHVARYLSNFKPPSSSLV